LSHRVLIKNFTNRVDEAAESPAEMALKSQLRDIVSSERCVRNREGKKSDVLSLMFVHDADIDNIEIKLLKDKAVSCGTPIAVQPFVAYLPAIGAGRSLAPSA
jgi:hypothetical protein